jgi:hypothetical protein
MDQTDQQLRYWAVLAARARGGDGELKGFCTVAVTDGDRAPHTTETVRKMTEIKYGRVEVLDAVGPMLNDQLARDCIHSATSTLQGLNHWLAQAGAGHQKISF